MINKKSLRILIVAGLLVCITACGGVGSEKKNYTICSQRIIEFSKTIDSTSDSYPEKLRQKVLEVCNIYGFRTIDEFTAAKNKYQDESNTPDQREKLSNILKLVAVDSSTLDAAPVPSSPPRQKPETYRQEETSPADPPGSQKRAISLKILQQKLEEYHGKKPFPRNLSQLCGITEIIGYAADEVNRDILLLGKVDESLPPLYLEDFVIALRNAWLKYARLEGNTRYYSNPGCTIDPDPKVLKRLDDIKAQLNNTRQAGKIETVIHRWKSICRSPQKVGVFGVPFDTRFSWVMVKADYDMKLLVDGSDSLDIPGFSSLIDMELQHVRENILNGKSSSIPLSSLNRFWFHPGKNSYLESHETVIIAECNVVLLTEQEYLTRSGKVVGRGRPGYFAKKFTDTFSTLYPEIARRRPIYRELENLYRFVALAKILKLKIPHTRVGLDIDYLLHRYPVSSTPVDKFLPGRSNVKGFKHREEHGGGYSTYQFWLPSCGGVSIDIEAGPGNFSQDQTNRLNDLRDSVLNSRPSPDSLSWDWGSPTKRKEAEASIDPQEIRKLGEINRNNAGSASAFIVRERDGKYSLYYNSTKPLYEGENKYLLLQKAMEQIPDRQRDKPALFFDLEGFTEKGGETFAEAVQTLKIAVNPGAVFVIIPRKNNAAEFRDILLSPGIKTGVLFPGEPAVEKVAKGKYKGLYGVAIDFAVRKRGQIKKLTLRAFSKVRELLVRFSEIIRQKRSAPGKLAPLYRDAGDAVKEAKKTYEGKGKIEIIVEFLEQVLGIDIGFLNPPSMEEDQMVKAAA